MSVFKQKHKLFQAKLRQIRMKLGKIIWDRPPPKSDQTIDKAKSILFLRQDGKIGDCVVGSFVFSCLKFQNPKMKIGVLCHANNRYLFDNNPDIDEIHVVNQKGMWAYFRVGLGLRGKYDVVVEPTLIFRVREWALLRGIGAAHNVGYLKPDFLIFNHQVSQKNLHYAEVYREIVRLLGYECENTHYRLPENPHSTDGILNFIQKNQLDNYIAVNFFGASRSRCFSWEKMAALLSVFTQNYPEQKWVLLGFPEVNGQLSKLSQNYQNVVVYEPTQTIFDNIELIRHARAVISVDTAVVHIAVALSKPLIGLYNNDEQNFQNWQPNHDLSWVIRYGKRVDEVQPEQFIPLINQLIEK